MIINTGVRTDIPAFYSKWFINRIRQGYVMVRNPYYPKKVIKYELNPNVVDCIDFCTKNPEPMLKYLDELKNYNTFWYVTITPYSKNIEPNVPSKEKVQENMKNHFENSPLLIGNLNDDDEIIKAKQYSYKVKKEQMNLFENSK